MDIEKADYGTIIKFGDMQDLYKKLWLDGKRLDEIIDYTDENGISLLEKSLIARKFNIAKELLEKNAKVNIVSKDGCNEFHYIASNINHEGAIEIAYMLLDKKTSLIERDNKYGNTAFFVLCQEILKVRSTEGINFIERCFNQIKDYDICNKKGYSIRMLINERGTDKLKSIMENEK